MTLYKLSPDQARELARRFGKNGDVETTALIASMDAEANRMQTMIGELDTGVRGMDWAGRRATKFDNMWTSEFKPAMERMRDAINDFMPVLRRMQASLKEAELAMNHHARDTEAIDGVV